MSKISDQYSIDQGILKAVGCYLVPLPKASATQRMDLLRIRNMEHIRRNMYNDKKIEANAHFEWCKAVSRSSTEHIFIVLRGPDVVGQLGFRSISWKDRRCDWAFYLDPIVQGQGIGGRLERTAIRHVFDGLGFLKLNCEVLAFNVAVVEMHKYFGFVVEGIRRAHIVRDGLSHDVVMLGMTAQEYSLLKVTA